MTSTRQSRRNGLLMLLVIISGCAGPDLSVPDLAMPPPARSVPDLPPVSLSLSAVSPPLGPSSGGLPVTLAGADFTAGATVTFGGGATASKVQVISATQMTVLLPPRPGVQGRVPVTVTTVKGSSVTRDDLFSYYPDRIAFGQLQLALQSRLPGGIAIGDLNGDHKLDLVATISASDGNGWVNVLLGNGDGTFQPYQAFALGQSTPAWVAILDLNGDDNPDLALLDGRKSAVSVLLGNGDGTFQPAMNVLVGVTLLHITVGLVAIGDLNGDGKPDLAVADEYGGGVRVLLGNGDGTFQPAMKAPAGINPLAVAIGDLDGDGKPDLAVASANSGSVSVLLGNGDGTFQPARGFPIPSTDTWSVVILDLDGDHKPDLVTANHGGDNVSVLLGNGDGTFQPARSFPAGPGPSWVTIGDLNGDSKPDLAVANYGASSVSVLLGNGDGTFQPVQSFPAGASPALIVVGDLNGDAKPDLVATGLSSSYVNVLLNTSQ